MARLARVRTETHSDNGSRVFLREETKGNWEVIRIVPNLFKAEQFATILWENGEVSDTRYKELLRGLRQTHF